MSQTHYSMMLNFVDGNFVVSDGTQAIEISRRDASVATAATFDKIEGAGLRIYGIVGIARLLRGPYLVVITDREVVGQIRGQKIWKVTGTKIIPFKEFAPVDSVQEEDEERYLSMLKLVLGLPGIYFSYTYDITHSLQRQTAFTEDDKKKPLWQRADRRFFWNRYLLEPLIQSAETCPEASGFILPLMMGYCGIGTVDFDSGHKVDFALISRRNVNRPGTRFWVRGLDENGNAANNVETEQILTFGADEMSAFVQTRGSIPVQWTQYVNTAWAPKPVIREDSSSAFNTHFNEQIRIYGEPQLLVNLANQHGSEGRLVDAYGKHAAEFKAGKLTYVAFDFHKECPGINWSRLSTLQSAVVKHVDEIGCFDVKSGEVKQQQKGTIRTNCIDNLDRTNVVQAMFARAFLLKQLQVMGAVKKDETIDQHPALDQILRNMWADNADFISKQYAGAGALKTDFTRLGKRTPMGLVQDGMNSIQRYVVNNFYDGFKQDSLNLFLGYYKVKPSSGTELYSSPFPRQRDVFRTSVYTVLGGLVVLLVAGTALSPLGLAPARVNIAGASWNFKFIVAALWGGALFAGQFYVKKNGANLVNKPVLVPPPTLKPKED